MSLRIEHGLSESELAQVARTLLNWGQADYYIGRILQQQYEIADGATAADLVHPLDTRKKVALLRNLTKAASPSQSVLDMVKELSSVTGMWSDDRNYLAHAFTEIEPSALVSSKKGAKRYVIELPSYEARSVYLVHLVALIVSELMGTVEGKGKLPPLPDRPS